MGIDLVFIEPNDDDFDEGYFIKTDNYVISIASLHDSVLYAYYKYEFKNTFVEGIKEFHKSDNTVHKFDWEYWQGGYKQEYSDISDHAIANQKIDSCVAENNTSSCCVSSYYQAPFSDKYLFSTVSYDAWSVGGMDPDTGLGLSRLAESVMFIDFGVRTSPVLPSVRPELN